MVALTRSRYIDSDTDSHVTLQGTLMNHSRTVEAIDAKLNVWNEVADQSGLRFAFTEVGSLFNVGKVGVSDTFGAAVWTLDFNLYCAAQGVARVHWQQGTNFLYNSWQPISTSKDTQGVKAPYYGLIAAATFLGDLNNANVHVVEIRLSDGVQSSGYAAYDNGLLSRLALIQMTAWNVTQTGTRPTQVVTLKFPSGYTSKQVCIARLLASGSDAISGVTFGNTSFDSPSGEPVIMNTSNGVEVAAIGAGGLLVVELPWSSAAIIMFE